VALALDGGPLHQRFGALLVPGERNLAYAAFGHDRVAIESRAIQFADDPSGKRTLTFSVAVSLSPYEEQQWRFRRELIGWFAGLMLVLLVTMAALLHWVLGPVRRMEREIHEVEEGALREPRCRVPARVIRRRDQPQRAAARGAQGVTRYRDTLGNLAHSLKTPLAVMRASLSGGAPRRPRGGGDRSHDRHHRAPVEACRRLRRGTARAGAGGGGAVGSRAARPLLKVYAGKDLSLELVITPATLFVG